MIKKAKKEDSFLLSQLIFNAIGSVANTLTGENENEKILQTLEFYIKMDYSRLSHNNIWFYEVEKEIAGMILTYDSNESQELDLPLIKYLQTKDLHLNSFDKESFENEFYIDTLSVSEKFQRKGIGTKLLSFIEEKAKELGFNNLSLLVDFDNPDALKLYKKIGFKNNTTLNVSNHNYMHMKKTVLKKN